jgi:hypothetical protein
MNQFPIVVVQEFGAVHGHNHFGYMAKPGLILWQRANHITQSAGFGNREAFGTHVNYFH